MGRGFAERAARRVLPCFSATSNLLRTGTMASPADGGVPGELVHFNSAARMDRNADALQHRGFSGLPAAL